MPVSKELISEFVKVTTEQVEIKHEATVQGTIVIYNEATHVQLDGSDLLTPITTTTDVKDGDRVMVLIKNHTATVTGNITSPSARTDDVKNIGYTVTEFQEINVRNIEAINAEVENLTAKNATITGQLIVHEAAIEKLEAEDVKITGKLDAVNAEFDKLDATYAKVESLNATNAKIVDLEAANAEIRNLTADYGEFKQLTADNLDAVNAEIDNLDVKYLSAENADLKYATIEKLEAAEADIDKLNADKINASEVEADYAKIVDLNATNATIESLGTKYANIDFANIGKAAIEEFFSKSGMIDNLVVGDGTITGKLVGVTIVGDLIEANTLKADRLVVKGEDGLYYKLNFNAGTFTDGEVVPDDSLHGSIITANSITAEKISVKDLVAFDATIGGFDITDNAIHSQAKTSADNTTRGIYMDNDGQFVVGDNINYLKYFKDADGNYKLDISAASVILGSNGCNVETVIAEIEENVEVNAESLRQDIDTNSEGLYSAQLLIDSIKANIATLVKDMNGQSMMTQDGSSWTFSMAAIQEALNEATNGVNGLDSTVSGLSGTVNSLNDAVSKLGETAAYVRVKIFEDKPCIELGKNDSPFRVLITNTDIRFMENEQIPASINNQSLYIEKAVISEELQQGDFVWIARSNGNYGLLWKGV